MLNLGDRSPLTGRRAAIAIGVSVVAPALIGVAELANGPDYGLILFYMIPVIIAGNRMGRAAAVATAISCAVAGFLAAYFGFGTSHVLLSAWNGLSSLVMFLALGLASSRFHLDQQELRALNARLREMLAHESETARTDALTGLPNSRALQEHLHREIARCRRDGTPMAVLYFDLDNFKRINDQEGHAAGDGVLCQVADAMRACVRASDIAARVGGDEFALALSPVQPAEAESVADRLLASMAKLRAAHPGSDLGASIGIAWFDQPPQDADAALRIADRAMYASKEAGKGRHTTDRETRSYAAAVNTPR